MTPAQRSHPMRDCWTRRRSALQARAGAQRITSSTMWCWPDVTRSACTCIWSVSDSSNGHDNVAVLRRTAKDVAVRRMFDSAAEIVEEVGRIYWTSGWTITDNSVSAYRAAASITSAVLQDIGIIHEGDISQVIDRSNITSWEQQPYHWSILWRP